ncbi:helix-turn-helix domain-containing protein [Lactobacillus delbrueckii]|uniref:helix-turn-helix domain-containing protein n=1 Tax=Lactobacillus delbrueckii TaxID=1584 RepID=UPI001F475F74|nr:helix-turn-helix transcriptional regulator [Lactobacillus delbrueckii]GHN15850.1 XRE family transcriptional regulator [Lactobacillus delbrueckii]
MYGQYFKRLRNYKKMTLGEAAKDITSSPTLSRWENGVDDIRLKKFLALLDRVDITPREFFAYTEVQGNLDNSYYDELQLLVQQKDGQRLHQIFLRQISSFHQTKDPDILGKAVAAANSYFSLTKINCLTDADLKSFKDLLLDSEYLDFKSLLFLENSVYLIDCDLLISYNSKVIHQLSHLEQVDYELYLNAWTALTNIVFSLIQQKQNSVASHILNQLLTIDLPQQMAAFKIRIVFLKKLLAYRESGDDREINAYLKSLTEIGLSNLVSELLDYWDSIY